MTERKHPLHEQAEALAESQAFTEWLDEMAPHSSGWPHSPTMVGRFICQFCGVSGLDELGSNTGAAAAFEFRKLVAVFKEAA